MEPPPPDRSAGDPRDPRVSAAEDAAIERADRMTWKQRRVLANCLSTLENSRKRALAALAAWRYDDYRIERDAQNRQLDHLLILKPSLKSMPLEEAYERAAACG